ncbi:disulfide bond formation protein B [Candidatus Falkowbacteria bacterium]|nr:disulfide bond formation protein B [Candidatus Falkowbacteria bacterium]
MVIKFLATLVIAAQAVSAIILVSLVFRGKLPRLHGFLAHLSLPLAFATALVATLGSLYLSEIAGFKPCDLCWFQRIFMYPQAILLGLALLRREMVVICYSLPLLFIGLAISLYHNYIVYQAVTATFCSAIGEISCTQQYIVEYGYVTIPLMSLTAFLLVILSLLLAKSRQAQE